MIWQFIIAVVALSFSIICFGLFFKDATKAKPDAQQVAREAAAKAATESFDPRVLSAFAKELAGALSKVGPGLVALIGALLFLLLAGEAANVYHLMGSASAEDGETEDTTSEQEEGTDKGDSSDENESVNTNGGVVNEVENAT